MTYRKRKSTFNSHESENYQIGAKQSRNQFGNKKHQHMQNMQLKGSRGYKVI